MGYIGSIGGCLEPQICEIGLFGPFVITFYFEGSGK